jgi:hypothetical protein
MTIHLEEEADVGHGVLEIIHLAIIPEELINTESHLGHIHKKA